MTPATVMDSCRFCSAVVVVRCVACRAVREIRQGEVPSNEVPMCSKCFAPMVPESARTERTGHA